MERLDGDTAKTAYLAMELSKRSWLVGALLPNRDKPSIYRLSGGVTLPGCYRGWRGFDISKQTAWFCALKQGTVGSG